MGGPVVLGFPYANGNLNGQGAWANTDNHWQIASSIAFPDGTPGVYISAIKEIAPSTIGSNGFRVDFLMRVLGNSNSGQLQMNMRDASGVITVGFEFFAVSSVYTVTTIKGNFTSSTPVVTVLLDYVPCAFSYDGTTVRFYYNGVLISSLSFSSVPLTGMDRIQMKASHTSGSNGRFFISDMTISGL